MTAVTPSREALLDECWSTLVEMTDRTSPEEYPDMCLITRDELGDFLRLAAKPADTTQLTERPVCNRTITSGGFCDDLQCPNPAPTPDAAEGAGDAFTLQTPMTNFALRRPLPPSATGAAEPGKK